MATITEVTGKSYKILADATAGIWHKISMWTKASDVYNNSNKTLETTCGSITGITSSLTSTSTTMAASASAIKQLNDKIADLNSNLKGNEITKIPGNNRIDAGTTLQEMCVLNCEGKSTITFTPIGYGHYGNGTIMLSVYGANTLNEAMVGNYNISCTDRELIQTINFNSGTEYSVNISGYKYVSFSAKNNNTNYASVDLTHVQLS